MNQSAAAMQPIRVGLRSSDRFFAYMATIMLLLVFVAFSRSFYFREYSTVTDRLGLRELVPHLVVHGWVLSAWYVVFCVQSWLGSYRRLDIHRLLGMWGAAIAVAVVLSGGLTTIRMIDRNLQAGRELSSSVGIVASNFMALVLFSVLVAVAIYLRRRGAVHKRLMLLASMAIMSPAFAGARGGNRVIGAFFGQFLPQPVGVHLGEVALAFGLAALIAHDVFQYRKVLNATTWGVAATVASVLVAVWIENSEVGLTIVRWLA